MKSPLSHSWMPLIQKMPLHASEESKKRTMPASRAAQLRLTMQTQQR